MKINFFVYASVYALTAINGAQAQSTVPVTVDNFIRAESDMYATGTTKEGDGVGKLNHRREPASIDKQTVIRLNRDTLYSSAVFDFDGGPVTITLPDAGNRFMSLQVINQDHYVPAVVYGACAVYGFSVGNNITLSPLIIQREYPAVEFPAIVALSTAVVQILYAFGPGLLGILRDAFGGYGVPLAVCMVLNLLASALILMRPRLALA